MGRTNATQLYKENITNRQFMYQISICKLKSQDNTLLIHPSLWKIQANIGS